MSRGRGAASSYRGNIARVNEGIRVPKVRLVDEEGNQLGIVDTKVGIEKAIEKGLDLVEVASKMDPPVCRIMDYSKFKYEQEKKQKLAKKKQHMTHLKEMRFKPTIEENDYQVKLKHIKDFLSQKDKVRITLKFRGREASHKEHGMDLLNRLSGDISAIGTVETPPKEFGKTVIMILAPKSE